MDFLKRYLNEFIRIIENIWISIKKKIFGANNERLDFIIDSFSKLEPEQRIAVIVSSLFVGVILVVLMLFLYFSRLNKLESELSYRFDALSRLYVLKQEYQKTFKNYNNFIQYIRANTINLKLRPFFEEMSKKTGVEIQGLNEQRKPIPPENKLSENIQYIKADMRFPNISIPRLLNFVTEVEKSGNFLSLENIQIRSKYGTRLFFDVQASFRGYSVIK